MRNPVKSFSIAVHGAVPLKAKINNGELSSEYDLPKAISEALDFYVTGRNAQAQNRRLNKQRKKSICLKMMENN